MPDEMNPVFTFAKKIKEPTIREKDISDPTTISKIAEVIGRLESLPKAMTCTLDEIELMTNPQKWVRSLIRDYPDDLDKADMENLLVDFTDSMRTRMREETKYALGILLDAKLLLCHSVYGEETITPEWKIIPRMLDTDNVLRYIIFFKKDGVINVKCWERDATSSFIEWLGLPRKQAFLFGGKYRIRSEIEGITLELQLNDEEIDKWLKDHPEFKDGRIDLPNPVQLLSVHEITAGRKRYQDAEDFIQDYQAEQYGVPRYRDSYDRLATKGLPLLVKYYDERTQVVRKEGDEEVVEVKKSTQGFEILFANGAIEMRASYVSDLALRFINGETLRLFHAGVKFSAEPFVVGNMSIFNRLRVNQSSRRITDFHNSSSLQDQLLDRLIKYVVLRTLQDANSGLPMSYVLGLLSEEVVSKLAFRGRLTKVEDDILEYKSRDMFGGRTDAIVSKITSDLRSKLQTSECKVYLIGVEDDGSVDPIPASRIKSDRLESIRKSLTEDLQLDQCLVLPVIAAQKGLILIIALKQRRE